MKHSILVSLASTLIFTGLAGPAQAGSKEDAVALVEKAVAHVKKNGVDAACKDFASPNGGFIQGDLYVFVQDMQVKMICHAVNPKLNGKDLAQLKDADGKPFAQAMTDVAKSKGTGWVDYQWVNPTTKAIEAKTSYVQRVNDTTWLGVGIYRK